MSYASIVFIRELLRLNFIFSIHILLRTVAGTTFMVVSVESGLLKRGCETVTLVGDDSDGGPPDPIPNSVVKPDHADGTARVTLWESRYRRPSFIKPLVDYSARGFCVLLKFGESQLHVH